MAGKQVKSITVEPELWELAKAKHYNMSAYIMDLIREDMKYGDPLERAKEKATEYEQKAVFYNNIVKEREKALSESQKIIEEEIKPLDKATVSIIGTINQRGNIPFTAIENVAKNNSLDPFELFNNLPETYKKQISGVKV